VESLLLRMMMTATDFSWVEVWAVHSVFKDKASVMGVVHEMVALPFIFNACR
jgi:hypothetical protein